jgi:hypothetical protein
MRVGALADLSHSLVHLQLAYLLLCAPFIDAELAVRVHDACGGSDVVSGVFSLILPRIMHELIF